ncbi:hypothetical protein OAG76_04540 [Rubripirellula sp.]|nr:hypothetical protein [Rubripirellula sp.]MDB4634656.1 hypothetical protein [Rubripirellula sp.]
MNGRGERMDAECCGLLRTLCNHKKSDRDLDQFLRELEGQPVEVHRAVPVQESLGMACDDSHATAT